MIRKSINCIVTGALVLGFLTVGVVRAADKPKSDPKMDEMMKKWEQLATPGEHHKILEALAGSWNTNAKWWMAGSDQAGESKGASEIKWTLGGRFLYEESLGEMMGQPFEGRGYYGYDNFKNKYVFFWIDNSATSIFTGEGDYNPAEKTITFNCKMDDPMTGEKNKPITAKVVLTSDTSHTFEMWEKGKTGKQMKTAEITYTKK
jgi:hypothetical protein